jgi:transcriptional regulator
MKTIDGNKLRGHLDMLVMAVLEQGEAHGYAVLQRLEARGCDALKMKEGTLYPVLYRLEEAGYIRGTWEDSAAPRRGPRRRLYCLTPSGKRELAKHREEWQQFTTVIGNVLGANT